MSTIQVLDRAMALLDALAQKHEPVSLKELSLMVDIHPSTAHRILSSLMENLYVEKVQSGQYKLGMRLLELGYIVKNRMNVHEIAVPAMQELHKKTGQPVNLSIRQGDDIVYIERTYNEHSGMQVVRNIGARAKLHLTSTGKLFLAQDDIRQVRSYALRTGLSPQTANSINDLSILEKELQKVKQLNYARDNEELELGVCCIAAAIYDNTQKIIAGLSVSAPALRMQEDWIDDVKETAWKISSALGYKVY